MPSSAEELGKDKQSMPTNGEMVTEEMRLAGWAEASRYGPSYIERIYLAMHNARTPPTASSETLVEPSYFGTPLSQMLDTMRNAPGHLGNAEIAWLADVIEQSRTALTEQRADSVDEVADFLAELDGWERAYPLSAFPEPDLARAAELLKAGGMTLDAISAANMRHVVSKIAPKARAAITALTEQRADSVDEVERLRDALEDCRRYMTQHGTSQSARALHAKVDAALANPSSGA